MDFISYIYLNLTCKNQLFASKYLADRNISSLTNFCLTTFELQQFMSHIWNLYPKGHMCKRIIFSDNVLSTKELNDLLLVFQNQKVPTKRIFSKQYWHLIRNFNTDLLLYIAEMLHDQISIVKFAITCRSLYHNVMNKNFAQKCVQFKNLIITDKMLTSNIYNISDSYLFAAAQIYFLNIRQIHNIDKLPHLIKPFDGQCVKKYLGYTWLLSRLPSSLKKITFEYIPDDDNVFRCRKYDSWLTLAVQTLTNNQLLVFTIENDLTGTFTYTLPAQTVIWYYSGVSTKSVNFLLQSNLTKNLILHDSEVLYNFNMDYKFDQRFKKMHYMRDKKFYYFNKQRCNWRGILQLLHYGDLYQRLCRIFFKISFTQDPISLQVFLFFLINIRSCDITIIFECNNHDINKCNHLLTLQTVDTWLISTFNDIRKYFTVRTFKIGYYAVDNDDIVYGCLLNSTQIESLTQFNNKRRELRNFGQSKQDSNILDTFEIRTEWAKAINYLKTECNNY